MLQKISLFDLLTFNSAFVGPSRAILKGFTGGLNFMITALIQRQLSNERNGRPDTEVDHRTGVGEPDAVTEGDGVHDQAELEAAQREEQGHEVQDEPLVIAGRLKSVHDWVATVLLDNARMRVMPDSTKVPDPFHLATTIENTLHFRATAPVRIDEAKCKAKAEMYGLPVDEIKAPIVARNKRMQLATIRDAERIMEVFHALQSLGEDGHELECEASFDRLHPLYQTRVLVALDRSALNAYKGFVAEDVQGTRADAGSDAVHTNGFRWEIRRCWKGMLEDARFGRLYAEIAQTPVWPRDPMRMIERMAA